MGCVTNVDDSIQSPRPPWKSGKTSLGKEGIPRNLSWNCIHISNCIHLTKTLRKEQQCQTRIHYISNHLGTCSNNNSNGKDVMEHTASRTCIRHKTVMSVIDHFKRTNKTNLKIWVNEQNLTYLNQGKNLHNMLWQQQQQQEQEQEQEEEEQQQHLTL